MADNTSYAPNHVINDIPNYSRQLAEYVDVYCAKQSQFNYELFTTMLVIQAGVIYIPMLWWNIKPARKILCHLRFLVHDIDQLYQDCKKDDASSDSTDNNKQTELRENIHIWQSSRTLYDYYMIKHILTVLFSIIFIVVYSSHPPLTVLNIRDEFFCKVKEKFEVDCTLPSAVMHTCVWGVNMALLCLNICSIIFHIVILLHDCCYGGKKPFRNLGIIIDQPANDAHLIYMFLQANIESIEKFNYVRVLDEVISEEPTSTGAPPNPPSTSAQTNPTSTGAPPNPPSTGAPPNPTCTGAPPNPPSTGAPPNPTNTICLVSTV